MALDENAVIGQPEPLPAGTIPGEAALAVRQHLINNGCTIPIDVIREALAKAEPSMAAAERTGLCEVLGSHYLASITCDHERKMDRPECACSLIDLGWHRSVGEAVQAWIRHVMWQRAAGGARPDDYDPA